MIAGLLLAVGCAIAGSVAMLLKRRGAVAAPTVLARHPMRSAISLFGSKWWPGGVAGRAGHMAAARRRAVARVAVARKGRDLRRSRVPGDPRGSASSASSSADGNGPAFS
jgi:hypothetical protein